MIMFPYDVGQFINRVKEMGYLEILEVLQHEVYKAELGTSKVKGAVKKRKLGALEYAANLKALIFFLNSGIRPSGVSDHVFYSFKPIIQNLVDKKQFKHEALNIFKG